MGHIRAFTPADIPNLAGLWLRVFRKVEQEPSPALAAYFHEVFFNSPWQADDINSLVYESAEGELSGFIGVVARQMLFRDRPIRVAVATQFMIDQHQAPRPGSDRVAAPPVRRTAGPDLQRRGHRHRPPTLGARRRRSGPALLPRMDTSAAADPVPCRPERKHRAGREVRPRLRPLWRLVDAAAPALAQSVSPAAQ